MIKIRPILKNRATPATRFNQKISFLISINGLITLFLNSKEREEISLFLSQWLMDHFITVVVVGVYIPKVKPATNPFTND